MINPINRLPLTKVVVKEILTYKECEYEVECHKLYCQSSDMYFTDDETDTHTLYNLITAHYKAHNLPFKPSSLLSYVKGWLVNLNVSEQEFESNTGVSLSTDIIQLSEIKKTALFFNKKPVELCKLGFEYNIKKQYEQDQE